MAALIEKVVWTLIAVGIYALTAWPPMAVVAGPLKVLAGIIVGKAWLQSVDEKHAQRARSASIPPRRTASLMVLLLLLVVAVALAGCIGAETPAADTLEALDQVCAVRDAERKGLDDAASGVDRLHADRDASEVQAAPPPDPPAPVDTSEAAPPAASEPAQ